MLHLFRNKWLILRLKVMLKAWRSEIDSPLLQDDDELKKRQYYEKQELVSRVYMAGQHD